MRAISTPSVKTLKEIGIDDKQARLLRRLLTTYDYEGLERLMLENLDVFKQAWPWYRGCYNSPDIENVQLEMANDVVGGFGVEHCGEVDMRDGPPLEYVNLGDTYDLTLCRFRDRFIVSSWGDIVERHPKLFEEA